MAELVVTQSCKGCFFNKDKTCSLGRLEKFAKNGAEIVQEDGENRINGRYCSAYRKPDWALGKDPANLEVILRAETLIRTEVYVYCSDYMHSDLVDTLKSLQKQILKPSLVVFIFNCPVKQAKILRLLENSELPYRVDVIKDKLSRLECIDLAARKCRSYFYSTLMAGQTLHPDFLANLDTCINENLQKLVYVDSSETQGETVSIDAHKKFMGNQAALATHYRDDAPENLVLSSIKEKILFFSSFDKHEYMVKNVDFINRL